MWISPYCCRCAQGNEKKEGKKFGREMIVIRRELHVFLLVTRMKDEIAENLIENYDAYICKASKARKWKWKVSAFCLGSCTGFGERTKKLNATFATLLRSESWVTCETQDFRLIILIFLLAVPQLKFVKVCQSLSSCSFHSINGSLDYSKMLKRNLHLGIIENVS